MFILFIVFNFDSGLSHHMFYLFHFLILNLVLLFTIILLTLFLTLFQANLLSRMHTQKALS